MISPDLAETVKRLRELLPKEMSEPWEFIGGSVWHTNAKIGGISKLCDVRGWGYLTGQGHGALGLSEDAANEIQEAIGKHIAAANPAVISSILDALEGLERHNKSLTRDFQAFCVAVCDDAPNGEALKALNFVATNALAHRAKVTSLESSLAEARTMIGRLLDSMALAKLWADNPDQRGAKNASDVLKNALLANGRAVTAPQETAEKEDK
jgi:hypothetical protein